MTHEFKTIVEEALQEQKAGLKSVLASVVALDGSSYRRPGVRMLIKENGAMVGAVSGGCVEKEIGLQSQTVFKTGISKIMTYDGRYRLGCEGVLYVLLEQFLPEPEFEDVFFNGLKERETFEIHSRFSKKVGVNSEFGSYLKIKNKKFALCTPWDNIEANKHAVFKQIMPPCFKLIIVGAEHDAVQLCKFAALTGWEVTIVACNSITKSIDDFPGANQFLAISTEALSEIPIDKETAIVLMTHNFAKDLRCLVALNNTDTPYIGLLGPKRRREDLLTQFIEYCPNTSLAFLDRIHGPAGINIGAETPQEIAVSIISEILSVIRQQEAIPLSKKTGDIHA